MLCSDLERYLEAHLDGRLGRSRTAILRRHLAVCGNCRSRVDRLRRFERDLASQIWTGDQQQQKRRQQPGSVWQGLELDLVRSLPASGAARGGKASLPRALPAPGAGAPTAGRTPLSLRGLARPLAGGAKGSVPGPHRPDRRLSRLVGVLAVALAVGALYELARVWLEPRDAAEAAVQAYLDFVAGQGELALRTDDPALLQGWLADQLGRPFPAAPPVPEGFRLVGGARAPSSAAAAARPGGAAGGDEDEDVAVIVYAPADATAEARPTLLFVRPDATPAGAPAGPVSLEVAGHRQLAWEAEPYEFRLVSAEPSDRLRGFAP